MTPGTLLADLAIAGIHLEADGDRLRYYPRSAATPDLLARLRAHKAELLAVLRQAPEAAAHGCHTMQRAGPPSAIAASPLGPDGWPLGSIDPAAVQPCPQCGGLALWWPAAPTGPATRRGSAEVPPRCLRCDPPAAGVAWLEHTRAIKTRQRSESLKATEAALNGLRTACRPLPGAQAAEPPVAVEGTTTAPAAGSTPEVRGETIQTGFEW